MEKVTSQQLSDGLDAFYLDPKNRRILVADAVWVAANDIAGTSKKKMEELLQNSREEAGKHK